MVTTAQHSPALSEIQEIVREVCRRHAVARADVFGSVARGEAGPESDVDLLVEFLPEAGAGLLEMGALREDLAERLGRSVDVVSRRAIERSANPFRRRVILGSTVNVYVR
jgi:hypothetical protein